MNFAQCDGPVHFTSVVLLLGNKRERLTIRG